MKLTITPDELDFTQKPTLNKDFWQNNKLKVEVRVAIVAIVVDFLKSTNLDIELDDIDEVEFTGSLANYNHNKLSDVDIHLLFDFSKLGADPEFMQDYLTAKAINWNNKHVVTIFGHEVEIYVAEAGSEHHSTGIYSIKSDEWLTEPERDLKLSAELNLNKVKDKANKISKQIDMLASKGNVPYDKIENLKNKIKKMRESGLEKDGEYSIENLAFKLLRRRGELSTLYTLMNQARDAELSLDEDMEWWKSRRKEDNKNYLELIGHVRGAKKNKKGAPYMLDPHKKLPMSAPPGIMEEADKVSATGGNILGSGGTSQTAINKVIRALFTEINSGDEIKLFFNDFFDMSTGIPVHCLKAHSYTIRNTDGETYKVSIDGGNYKKIFHPKTAKMGFDPTVCLFDQRTTFDLDNTDLMTWISDQLLKGNISKIVFKSGDNISPTVTFTGDPSRPAAIPSAEKLSSLVPKYKDAFERARKALKSTLKTTIKPNYENIINVLRKENKDYLLNLVVKKDLWFITDIGAVLKDYMTVEISKLDFLSLIKEALGKLSFAYYKFGGKYRAVLKSNGKTVIERSSPGAEIKEKIVNSLLDKIDAALSLFQGSSLLNVGMKEVLKTAIEKAGDQMTLGNKTKGFSKKDYLENIASSTNGEFCEFFDCKKSTIKYKNKEPVSIEKFAKAALRSTGPTVPRIIDGGATFSPRAVGDVIPVNIDGKRGIRLPNNEIRLGGSLAWLNNNPGNLKLGKAWRNYGAIGRVIFTPKKGSGYHAVFLTYEDGYNALVRYLKKYMGNLTFRQFAENIYQPGNPTGWATRAAQAAGAPNIDQKMKNYDVDKIINGIKRSEGYDARKSTRDVIK